MSKKLMIHRARFKTSRVSVCNVYLPNSLQIQQHVMTTDDADVTCGRCRRTLDRKVRRALRPKCKCGKMKLGPITEIYLHRPESMDIHKATSCTTRTP